MSTASNPRWVSRGTGVLSALLLVALCTPAEAQRAASRGERFVDSLLARMTVEEKLGQLTQLPGQWGNTGPTVSQGGENEIRSGHVGSFLGVHGAAATRRFQEIAMQSRLKIPLLFAHDVIHGFRTIFPVSLAEAASWDPDAVERSARIAAIEATSAGLHWTFAPMVDIARDARWGRIVEGAGEDPYLGSIMAAARVRGFQGTDLGAPNTMMATAKHFVAYGAAEGGRDYNVADLSEITLRDIYLPPFHAAVEAGARSVMASFNEIAGVPVHASERLIDGLLRTEWRWNGLLVSDWTGVLELIPHGVAADSVRAGELALRAGVDVDMVSRIYFTRLAPLVRAGRVPMRDVNAAVRRVLIAKYELGLFDDPFRYSDTARERRTLLAAEHRAAARDLARKAIVLLKNENRTLPLSKSLGTVAVIGSLATDARSTIGNWAAAGRPEEGVTVLDGIRRAMPSTARVLYARGADSATTDTSGFAEAVRIAREADAVVLVVGEHQEQSAEANNRAFLGLPGAQIGLARAVLATGKPVVIVLMGGRPLAIPVLAEQAPAIMHGWYLGTEMGNAVADVVFGDANPSGKLPVSVPRTVGQVPLYYNHKNTGRPPVADQKYTSKYIDVPWTPLYPFGHGLSYTTFAYRNLRLSRTTMRPSDTLVVTVEVTNTGDRAGDEIVQLYVRDEVGSITRPVKELRGFRRISLRPGESQTVSFTLGAKDLAFHDADLDLVVERGFYRVFVGTSSERVEEARFELVDPRRCAKLVLRREVPRFTWPMKSRATVVQCGA
ncbi:MAG TPA: beta-glucosidase BglX [Gemmatimonadaceae bacterium]|nr:beta-glucosidase BglX [Gemmatimonadaceae bacterium]